MGVHFLGKSSRLRDVLLVATVAPHRDMEIVTVVLYGALEHRDSLGNGSVIQTDEIQKRSGGWRVPAPRSGVAHPPAALGALKAAEEVDPSRFSRDFLVNQFVSVRLKAEGE